MAPKRTIAGGATTLNSPRAVFVTGNEIFTPNATGNSVTTFNQNDNGDVAPKRTISGGATTLNNPHGLTLNFDLENAAIAISLFALKTTNTTRGVKLSWKNAKNINPVGFHVWRKKDDGEFKKISTLIIMSKKGFANNYSFTDSKAQSKKHKYTYKLQYEAYKGEKHFDASVKLKEKAKN